MYRSQSGREALVKLLLLSLTEYLYIYIYMFFLIGCAYNLVCYCIINIMHIISEEYICKYYNAYTYCNTCTIMGLLLTNKNCCYSYYRVICNNGNSSVIVTAIAIVIIGITQLNMN